MKNLSYCNSCHAAIAFLETKKRESNAGELGFTQHGRFNNSVKWREHKFQIWGAYFTFCHMPGSKEI